jgi:hypothetical protein
MSLSLERRLADRFVPESRRELFNALVVPSRDTVTVEGWLPKIDLTKLPARIGNLDPRVAARANWWSAIPGSWAESRYTHCAMTVTRAGASSNSPRS